MTKTGFKRKLSTKNFETRMYIKIGEVVIEPMTDTVDDFSRLNKIKDKQVNLSHYLHAKLSQTLHLLGDDMEVQLDDIKHKKR